MKIARQAITEVLEDEERYQLEDAERDDLKRVAAFFEQAELRPEAFRPMGALAAKIRPVIRQANKVPQPTSRRYKRKDRRDRRRAASRFRKRMRTQLVEQYNAAVEAYEKDMADARAAYEEAQERVKGEPRFELVDPFGNVQLTDIPESFIRPVPSE